jgi:hypothetical protein
MARFNHSGAEHNPAQLFDSFIQRQVACARERVRARLRPDALPASR